MMNFLGEPRATSFSVSVVGFMLENLEEALKWSSSGYFGYVLSVLSVSSSSSGRPQGPQQGRPRV